MDFLLTDNCVRLSGERLDKPRTHSRHPPRRPATSGTVTGAYREYRRRNAVYFCAGSATDFLFHRNNPHRLPAAPGGDIHGRLFLWSYNITFKKTCQATKYDAFLHGSHIFRRAFTQGIADRHCPDLIFLVIFHAAALARQISKSNLPFSLIFFLVLQVTCQLFVRFCQRVSLTHCRGKFNLP